MYATNGLVETLGVTGEELRGKSFYYCIQKNCLTDAIRCLELAKANDSIAYLRFWFRDPRQDDEEVYQDPGPDLVDGDSDMRDVESAGDESDRGARISSQGVRRPDGLVDGTMLSPADSVSSRSRSGASSNQNVSEPDSRTSSTDDQQHSSHAAVFGSNKRRKMAPSALKRGNIDASNASNTDTGRSPTLRPAIELEAVISCTSDGLVVCLRKASPFTPTPTTEQPVMQEVASPTYTNGLFAAPWASEPILPSPQQRPVFPQHSNFAPSLAPAQAFHRPLKQTAKPSKNDFMNTIREIAIFAWAITGINGSLADYGRGQPRGESQPGSGLPIWQPQGDNEANPEQQLNSYAQSKATSPSTRVARGSADNNAWPESQSDHNGAYDSGLDLDQPNDTSQPPHMVDGIDGAFDDRNERVDGIDGTDGVDGVDGLVDVERRYRPSNKLTIKTSGRNSGFGFGDPGLRADHNTTPKFMRPSQQYDLKSNYSKQAPGSGGQKGSDQDIQLPDGM